MQEMIHHHAQAIEMTAWVPTRTESRSVRLLAQADGAVAGAEIEMMERWLKAQGAEAMSRPRRPRR